MQKKTNDPIACGRRIKSARLLAGFSRREFQKKFGVSSSTLQSWEIGRNPLNEKSALKLTGFLKTLNLFCSAEWLLYGIGAPPRTNEELKVSKLHSTEQNENFNINWDDDIAIQMEIETFCKANLNAVISLVNDDGMEPFYSIGDYVGGKRYTQDNLAFNKHNCIVQFNDTIFIRRISIESDGCSLFCLNTNTTVKDPAIKIKKVEFVAPIIWHRKKSLQNI